MSTVSAVYGVPLQPGERVIYFHHSTPGWQKPLLIVVGLLTLVGIIGLFLLFAGITAAPKAYIITTERFIVVDGSSVSQLTRGEIKQVTRKQAGSIVKWINLSNGRGKVVSYQIGDNPPGLVAALDRYLTDPSAQAAAPTVEAPPGRA
jgi:hypothetical protein